MPRPFNSFVIFVILLPAVAAAQNIETIAGTGVPASNGSAGDSLKTNIGEPFGVEFGPDNALYICEVRNHRVWRHDPKTNQVTVAAGNGKRGYSGDGGLATDAELNEPYEVRSHDGAMYFVEMKNHLVRRVDLECGRITTVAGTGVEGFSGDGGPATEATFRQPHSIALDAAGNLYIADIGNHRIRRVDAETGVIETIAGDGSKTLPIDGGAARGKPVHGPRALTLHGETLFVALREGNSVWQLDLAADRWTHIAGTGKKGFSGDGGPAKDATFDGPKGIVYGDPGRLYVIDTENQAIRLIDLKSQKISTIAGAGPKFMGELGDGGAAVEARLARPHGICLDARDNVYIGDTNHHRVRVINQKAGIRKQK